MELGELIERLEKATGPNFALECDIARAVGWYEDRVTDEITGPENVWVKPGGRYAAIPPRYTSSLDAALTLVPEGMSVDLQTRNNYCAVAQWDYEQDIGIPRGTAWRTSTPAIALCIAALKARQQQ